MSSKPVKWAYGVTTVPSRAKDGEVLEKTLDSLVAAGFPEPLLFMDGGLAGYPQRYHHLEIVYRHRTIRAYGNWILGMWELYLRKPDAKFYAMFQDDLIACKNLRQFLEKSEYPLQGYWNLYTFPENVGDAGWHRSNQMGLGAVGLVFDGDTLRTLLSSIHMVNRVTDAKRGHKSIDGGVVTAMNKAGFREYVHTPSLIQHQLGHPSAIRNDVQPQAPDFPGADFDAMEFLNVGKPN